jgi:glyoxylase-like metal-dependent hydrolase (beta-lactamase superfamily II)
MPEFPKLPSHLAGSAPQGLVAGQLIAQYELGGPSKNFVYLIADWAEKRAAIVDPQSDLDAPLAALREHGLKLEAVLLTHTHWDHTAGLTRLAKEFPGLPFYVHPLDAHRLEDRWRRELKMTELADGQVLHLGSERIETLHTPGHSPGECSYLIAAQKARPPYLFTGDTIFIRDCGRTDFEGGSNAQMFTSIQRIKRLPAETVILPGHHYKPECASTVGRECAESPPFGCASVAELEALP